MTKYVIFFLTISLVVIAIGIYNYRSYQKNNIVKNTAEITKQYATLLSHDVFPITGRYRWTFFLGPIEQLSTHSFTPTFIAYQMRGKAHSTNYRMEQLSYDDNEKKWIGQTPEGIIYVLFFKNIHPNTVTLYKYKCTKGLPEAIQLQRPRNDETSDHGWNVYTLEDVQEENDILPFSGHYIEQKQTNNIIEITDHYVQWNDNKYKKMTHHLGERRWVGQLENSYIVMFYEQSADGSLNLSLTTYTDVEKAYKSKYNQQIFTAYKKSKENI